MMRTRPGPFSRLRSAQALDQRERNRLADALAGENHEQTVDAHAHATARREALLHGDEEVLVHDHGLGVAVGGREGLRLEALALDDRVGQLGVCGARLEAAHVQVPLFGESTFLQLVMREMKATSGKVWVLGKDVSKLSTWAVPKLRRQIGTVFQDFRLLPSKTVYENVALAMQVIGKPRHAIETSVPDALDLVGLSGKESRLPHELSGGEEQRVAIARAMVNRPELLLADEPTGNLDPETSLGIMRLLDRINRTGTTVVMATHDATIVNQMRKRVIELEAGDVIRDQNRGVYGAGR